MSDRIKLAALLTVALAALGTFGIVVYNFVANDWRLGDNPLDLSVLTGEEAEPEADARLLAHALLFGDSVRSVRIETRALRVRITESTLPSIQLRLSLAGDATDSSLFAWSAVASSGVLRVEAAPTGAAGNASGVLELAVPPSLHFEIIADAGEVSLLNVAGRFDITVTGGSLEATGMRGTLRARADRDIALDGCRLDSARLIAGEAVTLSLSEGAIVAEASEVHARRHFGALDATARGAIRAEILSSDAPVRLVTEEGDVHLRVLDGARFAYDVEAPRGTIVANVPFDTLTERNATEHRVRATMNGGGVPAIVRTARGNVEILLFEAGETSDVDIYVEGFSRFTGMVCRDVQALSRSLRRTVESS